jgi:hypothetical protein
MRPVTAVILVSAVSAVGAGWFLSQTDRTSQAAADVAASGFDASQPVEARIAALERAVSDERLARQLLQEEVFYLTSELERLDDPRVSESIRGSDEPADGGEEASREARRAEWRRRNTPEGRAEQLVEAGFLPAQAEWILKREQELQMDALQARFDAERSGEPLDWTESRTMASDALRAEMGDADYERYLEASDRPTRVSVSSVIESSPAQSAGLRPGDEILRYDGERVFSMTDLTRQTMEGEAGESVVIDVMRDGTLMQVVLPRGPVGITGGRRGY